MKRGRPEYQAPRTTVFKIKCQKVFVAAARAKPCSATWAFKLLRLAADQRFHWLGLYLRCPFCFLFLAGVLIGWEAAPLSSGVGGSAGVGGEVGENRSGSPSMGDLKGPAGENFNGLRQKRKKKKEVGVGREGRKWTIESLLWPSHIWSVSNCLDITDDQGRGRRCLQ